MPSVGTAVSHVGHAVDPVADEALRAWRTGGAPVRFTMVVGFLLVAVGAGHAIGFLLFGGPWQGPVAWRKPFAFGVSFGMTAVTLAWVTTRLRLSRRGRWWLLGPLSVAVVVEVGWVSTQRARGVASHFNDDTLVDALAFRVAGGGAISVVAAVLVAVTVLSWLRQAAPPVLTTAIRSGLAVLLLAQVVGGTMIQRGLATQDLASGPSHAIAPSGDLKLSHAVAMHAVQVLPLLALWLLDGDSLASRRLLRIASAGYALLTVASLLLALEGRSVLAPSVSAAAMALVGAVLLAAVAGVAVARVARPAERPVPAVTA